MKGSIFSELFDGGVDLLLWSFRRLLVYGAVELLDWKAFLIFRRSYIMHMMYEEHLCKKKAGFYSKGAIVCHCVRPDGPTQHVFTLVADSPHPTIHFTH